MRHGLPTYIPRAAALLSVLCWCWILRNTDSYYSVYLLTAAAGLLCRYCGHRQGLDPQALPKGSRWLTRLFALGFSGIVYLANGPLFDPVTGTIRPATPWLFLLALVLLLGGYVIFREILRFLALSAQKPAPALSQTVPGSGLWVLSSVWILLAAVYALVLYLGYYPGVLTYDSIHQLSQVLGILPFSNHHPYYYTRFIGLIYQIGMALFGSPDAAAACYSLLSILAMAGIFAYSVFTLYEATGSRRLSLALFLFYLLMPCHILYSFAMWKDVFFAAAVTGFVISAFRSLQSIGAHPRANRTGVVIFAFLMCLLRSNGLFAFVLSLAVFLLLFRRSEKALSIALCATAVLAWILTGPVMNALDIPQPRITESLSIPLQQVAQVVKDDCPLTPEQTALLEAAVDLDAVKSDFLPYISDPVKTLVNSDAFQGREAEYIKLYLQLGASYPLKYIQAWINQTKGYWNGGYGYWRFPAPYPNDLGISIDPPVPAAKDAFVAYERLFENTALLQPLLSIGLFVWLILLCGFVFLQRADKAGFFLTVPLLAVIASLVIATPVFSEFRYSYSIFCCGPFVFGLTFYRLWGKEQK